MRDKLLTSTDLVGSLAGIPVVNGLVNATLKHAAGRGLVESVLQVDKTARLPEYHSDTLRKRHKHLIGRAPPTASPPAPRRARWRCSRPATATTTSPASTMT